MYKQKGITRNEFITILFLVTILIFTINAIIAPRFRIARRIRCINNLKWLGTAFTVYANDYNDQFPRLPGNGPWSKELGFEYDVEKPDFTETGNEGCASRTISASLYLLVKEADMSPKSFICPNSDQEEFDGYNPKSLDIVDLWDFGANPYQHVSYSYHNPYGKFPADGNRSAAFAVVADMNPWFENGDIISPSDNAPPQIIDAADKSTWKRSNTINHEFSETEKKTGQNIVFADGHTANEKTTNVGVKNDNIYTFWSTEENPSEQDIQGGTAPTSRSADNDAKSETDSFLAI